MDTDAATAQHERLSGSGLEFKLHPVRLPAALALCLPCHSCPALPNPALLLPCCQPTSMRCPAMQLVLINVSDHYTRTRANSPDSVAAGVAVYGFLLGTQGKRLCLSACWDSAHEHGPTAVHASLCLQSAEQWTSATHLRSSTTGMRRVWCKWTCPSLCTNRSNVSDMATCATASAFIDAATCPLPVYCILNHKI